MALTENPLVVRIVAACATLIGVIVFFFIVDFYAKRKAKRDLKHMQSAQRDAKSHRPAEASGPARKHTTAK